jgi:hypothetical protein
MSRFQLLLLALLVTGGCTGFRSEIDPGIQLLVEPTPAAPGDSVVLVMDNASGEPIGYNLCTSTLERRVGESWQPVPSDRICTLELRTLDPGQEARFAFMLEEDISAGEYRAVTGVELLQSGEWIDVASEQFRIQPR